MDYKSSLIESLFVIYIDNKDSDLKSIKDLKNVIAKSGRMITERSVKCQNNLCYLEELMNNCREDIKKGLIKYEL
ncbi:hypothetical protein KNV66_gp01 [Bacillus phage DLc1]|uniref:Uncharacterized protein n=1 Tax=Bacillus phage DLc1 TaxID=2777318 RepID=A0A7M1RR97_9CAUD|nr:hypothetical protein KNV66_gp01 [Bacillus phage DLc1]QOR56302.1 hypothetical protein [Bacillus phage DLc1]